jgi:hypothetical protein
VRLTHLGIGFLVLLPGLVHLLLAESALAIDLLERFLHADRLAGQHAHAVLINADLWWQAGVAAYQSAVLIPAQVYDADSLPLRVAGDLGQRLAGVEQVRYLLGVAQWFYPNVGCIFGICGVVA